MSCWLCLRLSLIRYVKSLFVSGSCYFSTNINAEIKTEGPWHDPFFTFLSQRLGVLWWCCIGRWIITSETAKIYILGFCTFLVMAGVFKKVRKCIFRSPTFLSLTPMKSSMKCKFLSASERFDKNLKRKGLRFLATVYWWILSNQDSLKEEFKLLILLHFPISFKIR